MSSMQLPNVWTRSRRILKKTSGSVVYSSRSTMASRTIIRDYCSRAALLKHVRDHTLIFFRRAWMKLDEAQPGSLHLLPQEELATLLATDYTAMQGMILGNSPPFDDLLDAIGKFEARLNAIG